MKKALVCALLSIGLAAFSAADSVTMVLGGGLAGGTYFGEGVGGNQFEPGPGWFFEFAGGTVPGLGFDLGVTGYQSDNAVGASVVKGKTGLFYVDLLYYVARVKLGPRSRAQLFLSAGADLGSIKYLDQYDDEILDGSDKLYGLTAGVGLQLFFGGGFYLGLTAKPMLIGGNDLGQDLGLRILGGFGIGM
jgi:hypothetical protein